MSPERLSLNDWHEAGPEAACRYAAAWNAGDLLSVEPWLAEGFTYAGPEIGALTCRSALTYLRRLVSHFGEDDDAQAQAELALRQVDCPRQIQVGKKEGVPGVWIERWWLEEGERRREASFTTLSIGEQGAVRSILRTWPSQSADYLRTGVTPWPRQW